MSAATDPRRPLNHREPSAAVLLLWAAGDENEERSVREELLADLADGMPPGRVVRRGRPSGSVRGAVVTTAADAAEDVMAAVTYTVWPGGPRAVAVLFPGQGSQHAGMASALYCTASIFREAVDEVFQLWGEEGAAIRQDWLGGPDNVPAVPIDDVRRAQPLLFAVDYGLGRLLLDWGIEPAAALGHSAGEVVAATLAGIFTVADAVELVRNRVRATVPIGAGGMLAVAAGDAELRPYLVGEVAVAAVNAARQTMLAGPHEQLAAVNARLVRDEYTVRPVPATTPFHCPAMAPAVAEVERTFTAAPQRARFPVWSGYTGRRLTDQEARSPGFWARQLADTVHFAEALAALLRDGDRVLVEAGPGQTLTAFARRQKALRHGGSAVLPMLPGAGTPDDVAVLAVAAALWTEGYALRPTALLSRTSSRSEHP